MLFESREPEPLERLQLQLAGTAACFAAALGGKHGKRIKAEDFLVIPQWEERQVVKRTPEEVEKQWLAWAAWQNRKGKRRG